MAYTNINARILDKIIYTPRSFERRTNLVGEEIMVSNTFPVNPESKKSKETAQSWSKYSPAVRRQLGFKPPTFERDNEPFDVTIISLEQRGRGGRAYKVIDDDGFMFDLREPALLECIEKFGILPGGKLGTKCVWGVDGNLKLIPVGGDLYNMMVANAQAKKEADALSVEGKKFTPSTMTIGGVYERHQNNRNAIVYLGKFRDPETKKFRHVTADMLKYIKPDFDSYHWHFYTKDGYLEYDEDEIKNSSISGRIMLHAELLKKAEEKNDGKRYVGSTMPSLSSTTSVKACHIHHGDIDEEIIEKWRTSFIDDPNYELRKLYKNAYIREKNDPEPDRPSYGWSGWSGNYDANNKNYESRHNAWNLRFLSYIRENLKWEN